MACLRHPSSASGVLSLGPRSAYTVQFEFIEKTEISGRIFGPDNEPLKGVCVDLDPVTAVPAVRYLQTCSDESGHYSIKDAPAGAFRIAANRPGEITAENLFPTTYYPGVRDRTAAAFVTVPLGKSPTGLDIHLPQLHPPAIR